VQEDVADEIVGYLNIEASGYNFTIDDRIVSGLYGEDAPAEVQTHLNELTSREAADFVEQLKSNDTVTIDGRSIPSNAIASHSENDVIDTVRSVSRNSGALTVVGLVLTAWSASALFTSVRRSLNAMWDVDVKRPLVQQKLFDLALVGAFGVLLGASVASTGAIITLRRLSDEALGPLSSDSGVFWDTVPLVVPAILTFSVFAFLYRYLPNAQVTFHDIWGGALLATILFEILKNGFSFYVANFNNYDLTYGALGGVLLFMLWTYLTATILLLGAEVSIVYGRMQSGVYATQTGPRRSWQEHVKRFVRGLFVQQDGEAERRDAPRAR
jgi:YihY family inner membrane protein